MYLSLSHVRLFVTPLTIARQAPLSMGLSRQEYWSGFPFPSPGDFHDPGTKPTSPTSPASAGGFFTTEPPRKAPECWIASESRIASESSCQEYRVQKEGRSSSKHAAGQLAVTSSSLVS